MVLPSAAGLYDGLGWGYGTAVGKSVPVVAATGVHNFPVVPTNFIGRSGPVCEVAGLLERYRLVTVTGPGGAGKTRLAGEVAGQVAGRFEDGVWLVELAMARDPAQIPAAVAVALGVREQPGVPAATTLARVLARQQLLLVLDNCEHVISAAAGLCAELVAACDDLRILATSREALRVAGEARYRLAPLTLPDPDDPADAAGAEAVALFVDRARRADARFALDSQTGPDVARLVTRLDGMPLAIELAAARIEALGVSQLLGRLDDRFVLLASGDRLAPSRQQSLAATVEWSYQLLDERERRTFRAVSVFPGPFTLEGAEAVAGKDSGLAVLRLVDCSLVAPPQVGDGQSRYIMLETLRAYGAQLRAEAGEQDTAAAALARYALRVAEEAAAGLQTSTGEVAAARRLDAEDPTTRQVLAWAMQYDAALALRLAVALTQWWLLRGRLPGQYSLLGAAAACAARGSEGWCIAQFWLGQSARYSADMTGALIHFTAVCDAIGDRGSSRVLADCLGGRSITLANLGRTAEAAEEGRRSLAMARELGYRAAEARALVGLSTAAVLAGDLSGAVHGLGSAVQLMRQVEQMKADIPGWLARTNSRISTLVLTLAGDLTAAEGICAAALARAREVGDLWTLSALLNCMATLDVQTDRVADAAAQLRESLQIAVRIGAGHEVLNGLACCGYLCAAARRWAEAVTVWAAWTALLLYEGMADAPTARRRQESLREARRALGADRTRAAEERGTAMNMATAAEYALMLTAPVPPPSAAAAGPGSENLSARERELVILVAQGRTNAQIAAQLFISVRTVGSHLDRIRDKTGCRRRVDLTRLALTAGMV